ncbi:two-component system chemotaxis sensor kinase CheA [Aminivibrio pyruvatiphilus]|uniref:Chemotaxis protein CheA n=1 Tax=Aminivibrio pyruvatiphilus TaxID=1005740 RepID=A0A4R8MGF3_9BACT|nr:chemotaxis protein CheA [Aminivibrio pyruvatiphilus]TDY65073.1 two-component system chemotaxis sensor kinase CheA [Aminivibrio pyruvatiphilus]
MTNMDMSQYLGAFLDEAGDNLKHLDDLILAVEKDQTDMDNIAEIFRSAHTLKGMSSTMGFERMASLTHAMEDMLDSVRRGAYTLRAKDIDLLFRSLDTLQSMVDSIRNGGGDGSVETEDLVSAMRNAQKEDKAAAGKPEEAPSPGEEMDFSGQELQWISEASGLGLNVYEVRVSLSPDCLLKAARAYMVVSRLDEMGDIIKTIPPVEALENEEFDHDFLVYAATSQSLEQVREAVARVSEVVGADVREVSRDREPLPGASAAAEPTEEKTPAAGTPLEEKAPPAGGSSPSAAVQPQRKSESAKKANQTVRVDIGRLDKLMNLVGELVIGRARIERLVQEAHLREFDEPLSQLGRISGDIQELVTKLRMVPVSFIFERFPRLVRDLSKTLGKEIELVMEGQETELDRTVIDEIGDPMVHIIRNSIDHGIEIPAERKKAGKPEKGLIKISAYQEGSGVIIEVTDDGKGIDASKVRAKALANGTITEEESAAMSDEEVVNLIFLPGFSMAEKVTDVSGRGVGMDAVKTKVESLGGQFDVSTEVGVGTRVFVRLPLTLAIVLALLIKVGDETYALPLENVEETILVKKENVKTVHGTPATLLRGDVLTLCNLAEMLGTSRNGEEAGDEYPVVVVKTGKTRIGFIVDELIGQQDIVIKSLGRFLSKIRGIAGATILGDGNVALILDVAGLYGR